MLLVRGMTIICHECTCYETTRKKHPREQISSVCFDEIFA